MRDMREERRGSRKQETKGQQKRREDRQINTGIKGRDQIKLPFHGTCQCVNHKQKRSKMERQDGDAQQGT